MFFYALPSTRFSPVVAAFEDVQRAGGSLHPRPGIVMDDASSVTGEDCRRGGVRPHFYGTRQVTDMSHLFSEAPAAASFNEDIGASSGVTTMKNMFRGSRIGQPGHRVAGHASGVMEHGLDVRQRREVQPTDWHWRVDEARNDEATCSYGARDIGDWTRRLCKFYTPRQPKT